jgi:heat shock protein HslJ
VLLVGLLALVGCASAEEPTAAPAGSTITGIVWQWTNVINQTTDETTTVPDPASYTIIFNEDGTFTGTADCNEISGIYSQVNGFTITPSTATRAICGDASLGAQYVNLLGEVAAGGPDGAGGLALETAGGEKRMNFQNGGAAE